MFFKLIEEAAEGVGELMEAVFELPRDLSRGSDDAIVGILVLAGLAAIVAMSIGVHTYLRSTGRRLDARAMLGGALQSLWAVPVLAVVVLVGVMYVRRLDDGPRVPQRPSAVAYDRSPRYDIDRDRVSPTDTDRLSWVGMSPIDEPDRTLMTVSSEQYATVSEANDDALARARLLIAEDVRRFDPRITTLNVPLDVVDHLAVRRRYTEEITRQTATTEFVVHRVHLQVELSDRVHRELRPYWRSEVVARRLWSLGAVLGFLVIGFGTLATYLRLNELADGVYRTRLRFAAASLVTAAGLLAAVLV